MNLNDYAAECHAANDRWWRDPETRKPIQRNFGELIALCHSELPEALEGNRKNLQDDKLPHRRMDEVELVDCLIRIFDLAGASGMDLQGAYSEKMEFNARRHVHTFEGRLAKGGKRY
jgi:hypothetical protein